MAKRWRKQPDETGLPRVCQSPRGYELRENGEIIAHVVPCMKDTVTIASWYWYGFGQNTSNSPRQTADECKKQVKEYIKSKGL